MESLFVTHESFQFSKVCNFPPSPSSFGPARGVRAFDFASKKTLINSSPTVLRPHSLFSRKWEREATLRLEGGRLSPGESIISSRFAVPRDARNFASPVPIHSREFTFLHILETLIVTLLNCSRRRQRTRGPTVATPTIR